MQTQGLDGDAPVGGDCLDNVEKVKIRIADARHDSTYCLALIVRWRQRALQYRASLRIASNAARQMAQALRLGEARRRERRRRDFIVTDSS
jgi:hypothetical protein